MIFILGFSKSEQVSTLSNSAVTIGAISLQDFEVPTSIQFGGRQRLVIHRTSNGARTVEPLGPDDSQIRFQGIFSGPNAEPRVRALNDLRLSGSVVLLTWQSFQYQIVVESLTAIYYSQWWISYHISCVIIHQAGVGLGGLDAPQAVMTAALLNASLAVAEMQISLAALSSALGQDDALVAGTSAFANATTAAAGALNAIQHELDEQSNNLIAAEQDFSGPAIAASRFTGQLNCTGSLASAAYARSQVGRICSGLAASEE
jgi:hypothetical protein